MANMAFFIIKDPFVYGEPQPMKFDPGGIRSQLPGDETTIGTKVGSKTRVRND